MISIKLSSIFVNDQSRAETFYTETLGFSVKKDEPAGEHRWLTVGLEGTEFELLLEPNVTPVAKEYQSSLYKQSIPATMLFTNNIESDYKRLDDLGVSFMSEPMKMEKAIIAIFDDTCGNFITLCQEL